MYADREEAFHFVNRYVKATLLLNRCVLEEKNFQHNPVLLPADKKIWDRLQIAQNKAIRAAMGIPP